MGRVDLLQAGRRDGARRADKDEAEHAVGVLCVSAGRRPRVQQQQRAQFAARAPLVDAAARALRAAVLRAYPCSSAALQVKRLYHDIVSLYENDLRPLNALVLSCWQRLGGVDSRRVSCLLIGFVCSKHCTIDRGGGTRVKIGIGDSSGCVWISGPCYHDARDAATLATRVWRRHPGDAASGRRRRPTCLFSTKSCCLCVSH